ncbi:MAG: penicillin-binding protein 1C [Bacteroidetes bacterium]|nr:penicillin-binding protein 1C [Bacteroidota bacterium]
MGKFRFWFLLTILTLVTLFWFGIPENFFNDPFSTVLFDRNGQLLGARIAFDGQWRFPGRNTIPEKFLKCALIFEDRYFYRHPGINPASMLNALYHNIKKGKVVRGGSTITMQVIRLSRKGKSRTVYEKLIEMIMAYRLEISYSKDEIFSLYSAHAPFGGNTVGIDAAAWRYFGRSPDDLTWAESATLAVLPNAPSLINPGRNRELLLLKRNRLLKKILNEEIIDTLTYENAILEPLPLKPFPLPRLAPHLLDRIGKETHHGVRMKVTVDAGIQKKSTEILKKQIEKLTSNGIYNGCALIAEIESGDVVAYIGNVENNDPQHGGDVDVIVSPRSTGSILKPFLYCAMLNEGEILPATLVPDIPTRIGNFSPQNYLRSYDGAVPAKFALARSLNVPAVKMLQQFQVERFYHILPKMGLTTITKPADHYGLTLVLGGAEATLWDLSGVYASMARTLNHFQKYNGKYDVRDFHPLIYFEGKGEGEGNAGRNKNLSDNSLLSAASIYLTFEAMVEVNRPDEDLFWQEFSSSRKIAWKTGTSFGFRDAWAIGVTPDYVVGVWVGNADGEGRAGLTGISCAAPVMFDLFSILETGGGWFEVPYDELAKSAVCHESGYLASGICDKVDSNYFPVKGMSTPPCPYHRIVHLSADKKWRVNSDCEQTEAMVHKPWFVLPPAMEWYYKSKNPSYKELPPVRADCGNLMQSSAIELIYPKPGSDIYVPVELDGSRGQTVFSAVHRSRKSVIHWHLDENFIGSTRDIHQIGLRPSPGVHTVTLVDENGEILTQRFEVIGKEAGY